MTFWSSTTSLRHSPISDECQTQSPKVLTQPSNRADPDDFSWYLTTYLWVSNWLPFALNLGLSWFILILREGSWLVAIHKIGCEASMGPFSKPLPTCFFIHHRWESNVWFKSGNVHTTTTTKKIAWQKQRGSLWKVVFPITPQYHKACSYFLLMALLISFLLTLNFLPVEVGFLQVLEHATDWWLKMAESQGKGMKSKD